MVWRPTPVTPQTVARVTGVRFLITSVTANPAALVLYVPVRTDPDDITGAGPDAGAGVFLGGQGGATARHLRSPARAGDRRGGAAP